jgi:hypothetical protein
MTESSPPPQPDPAAPARSGGAVPPQPGKMPDRVARMAADIRARDAELVALRQALRRAEADLEALHRSTSWRITAPLRAVVRALRGGG